ncbi:MAG: hypothetical protein ABR520_07220 [Mycobacteriales bacterium]|nr:hypothetical protein [Frankia sp.]
MAAEASARRALVAWLVWGVAVAVVVLALLVEAFASPDRPPRFEGAPYIAPSVLATLTIGTLIAVKRPGNRIAWLFLAFALCSVVQLASGEYANYAVLHPALAGAGGAGVVAQTAVAGAVVSYLLILMLFPTGLLASRRWQVAVTVGVGAFVANGVGTLLRPGPPELAPVADNPWASASTKAASDVALAIASVLLVATFLAALLSMAVRWRRSHGVERQQLKWVVSAGAGAISLIALSTALVPDLVEGWYGNLIWSVGPLALPVATGIAVLRYRLYDIDRVISRTVTYAIVTLLLVVPYVVVVPLVTRIVGGSSVAVAAATLAVAAAFNPLRRRVQARVDRRFNRARYDAARTVEAFRNRLRDEVDLEQLTSDLLSVVTRTMQPAHATLWLREAAAAR